MRDVDMLQGPTLPAPRRDPQESERPGAGMADTSAQLGPTPSRPLLQSLINDRLLLSVFVCCVLLIAYQLSVTLLQPPWIKPATNWLRAALAWPQLLIVAWFAIRLLRTSRPGAAVWCRAAPRWACCPTPWPAPPGPSLTR